LIMALGVPAEPFLSCGLQSVIELASIVGQEPSNTDIDLLARRYPQRTLSMLEVKSAGKELGLELVGIKAELSEIEGLGLPAILHTRPDHFLLVAAFSEQRAKIVDEGHHEEVTAEWLRDRFSGNALLLRSHLPDGGDE